MSLLKKTILIASMILLTFLFTGCDFDDDCYDCYDYSYYPETPRNVETTTFDNRIEITWNPLRYPEFEHCRIYRSTRAHGGYYVIADTYSSIYNDYDVVNGVTYYYAVSSVDWNGYESDLSYNLVYDTPRPEGYGLILYPLEVYPEDAGIDFSEYLIVAWDDRSCDVFLSYDAETNEYFLETGNDDVDLMYWGPSSSLSDVDSVPLNGWDPDGWYPVYDESSYILWTADNHFAHVRITGIYDDFIRLDWAYQTDTGNPELMVREITYQQKNEILSSRYERKRTNNQASRGEK